MQLLSYSSKRVATCFYHSLHVHCSNPLEEHCDTLFLTNPAMAGALAVLHSLFDNCETVRNVPWLARMLLGTASPQRLAALQQCDEDNDAVDTYHQFALDARLFASATELLDTMTRAQTFAADQWHVQLGASHRRRASLHISGVKSPLTIQFSKWGGRWGVVALLAIINRLQ